jgi:hypothetical protein
MTITTAFSNDTHAYRVNHSCQQPRGALSRGSRCRGQVCADSQRQRGCAGNARHTPQSVISHISLQAAALRDTGICMMPILMCCG